MARTKRRAQAPIVNRPRWPGICKCHATSGGTKKTDTIMSLGEEFGGSASGYP